MKSKLYLVHSIYNEARYFYLKTEYMYNIIVEKSGLTLPQLRVLWIIHCFPGISLGEIAKIGSWTPPTITKILKILLTKNLVQKKKTTNKKQYTLLLTDTGTNLININRQEKDDNFVLFKLLHLFTESDFDFSIQLIKNIIIDSDNEIILSYIDKLNSLSLKINYSKFDTASAHKLKKIVYFYNLLRVFVLMIESSHRQLLLKYNITYPQLRALWVIEAFPGITSVQLSEISFSSPSTANLIVKNLYNKNLIYKEKSQIKNSLFLHITKSGEDLILDDFNTNKKNLTIFLAMQGLKTTALVTLNSMLEEINVAINNLQVKKYINETFKIIQSRK